MGDLVRPREEGGCGGAGVVCDCAAALGGLVGGWGENAANPDRGQFVLCVD